MASLVYEDDAEAVLSGKPFVYSYHFRMYPDEYSMEAHTIQNEVMIARFVEGFCPSCEKKLLVCDKFCMAVQTHNIHGICFCMNCHVHYQLSSAKLAENFHPTKF